MNKWICAVLIAISPAAGIAQTSSPTTVPAPMPAKPSAQAERAPDSLPPALSLSDTEAKNWVNKPVYSSDNKNVGQVAAFVRDASGKVTEMHADIGGFLGIGQTRVRLMPMQFTLSGERVVLNMASDQIKTLPKVMK